MAMPPTQIPSGVENNIEQQMAEIDSNMAMPVMDKPRENVFKLDPATKIPVSKHEGPMWEARKKASDKQLEHLFSGWDEAEYYYDNTQDSHRRETQGTKQGNRNYGKDRRDSFSMTQNEVYATVNSVVPNIYAKNPNVEVTANDPQQEEFAVMIEHLLNRVAKMKYAPGINLKPKVRKSIVRCEITNEAWVLIGWTKKDDSAEGARGDIARIGKELEDAKDQKEIERLEGELLALEESIDLLDPPGPFVRTLRSKQVRVDTSSEEDDFSDANWMMAQVLLPTNYLNARYRERKADGSYANPYNPTHVVDADVKSDVNAMQQEIDQFKLFDNSKDNPKDYGYTDQRTYARAKRTACWYCFDKVKRRYYLYSEQDWTWPIWVFDDPYRLPNFFPLFRLQYHSSPKANRTRGEVSHYLDQQDEINVIVDELNRARVGLRDGGLFDSNTMDQKTAEDIALNANKKLKGVKVPEGKKWEDLIGPPPMPTLQHAHLWETQRAMGGIARISGSMEAMKGDEFKTNTTNDAIAAYNSIAGVRLDEKRDAVEDFIADIMSAIMFLWLQFGDTQTTVELVGSQYAEQAQAIEKLRDPKQIRSLLNCSIEGGSTQKPTSAAKKAEALQVGQILGQFASTSPYVVLLLLKVFQRSFDSVVITDADWQELRQGIMMQLQQGAPQQGGGGENPDDAKIIQDMVAKGVPEEVARQKVAQSKQTSKQ